METINERAESTAQWIIRRAPQLKNAHLKELISTELVKQQEIDIDKACEWLKVNADKYIYDAEVSRYQPPQLTISGKCWEDLRKAMEGISENKEEIPSNPCNSDKNLQGFVNLTFAECLAKVDPEVRAEVRRKMDLVNLLTWQDIQQIVDISDDLIEAIEKDDSLKEALITEEAYYKIVLERFKEKSK